MAAVPRLVSLGIIPLMAFHTILLGEVYFWAKRLGLWLIFLCLHAPKMTLFLKREPALITFSQRTTTIFCPDRSCLARVLERRPKIWSFPSMIITFSCISHRFLFIGLFLFFLFNCFSKLKTILNYYLSFSYFIINYFYYELKQSTSNLFNSHFGLKKYYNLNSIAYILFFLNLNYFKNL